MAMTSGAALKTAQRKLKELASDAISIPSTQDLYDRKIAELSEAQRKLAEIVAKQIKIEKGTSRSTGDTNGVRAEKAAAEALIERLAREGGMLKAQIIEQRPKKPLSPQQQAWVDAIPAPMVSPYRAEEMTAANAELEAIVLAKRKARFDGNRAGEEALAPAYKEARLRVDVMSGGHAGHWPPYRPYATREDLADAIRKWGRK